MAYSRSEPKNERTSPDSRIALASARLVEKEADVQAASIRSSCHENMCKGDRAGLNDLLGMLGGQDRQSLVTREDEAQTKL